MAGPAADGSAAPAADDQHSDRTTDVGRAWRRLAVFLAHWRLRVAVGLGLVGHALRRAWRYARQRGRGDEVIARVGTTDGHLLPTAYDVTLPVEETGQVDGGETVEGASGPRYLPAARGDRRRLPSGDGGLDVERDTDRLVISDPAREEAYLASTVWVDVEK